MANAIRLLLVDDHALLRQGTAELLRQQPDMVVVGEAADGEQAVDLARRVQPDLVVMDIRMPTRNGISATREICECMPEVKVLVLTAYDDDQYIFSLLQAGASGYIMKTAPVAELVRAIRQVMAGESPLSPAIMRKVVTHMQAGKRAPFNEPASSAQPLTPREAEVLQLLARGMSNQAIAEALFISDRTVQAHLTSIFAKLGVASRLDAVITAIRRGLLILEA